MGDFERERSDPVGTSNSSQSDALISHVKIFPDSVLITRTWSKLLQPGVHHLRFNNFVQLFRSDSLRVKVDDAAILQEVTYVPANDSSNSPPFTSEKQEKLTALEKQKRDLALQLNLAEKGTEAWELARQNVLQSSVSVPSDATSTRGSFSDFVEFVAKYEEEFMRLHKTVGQLKDDISTIVQQMNEINLTSTPAFRHVSDIRIVLDVVVAGPVFVQISYMAAEAAWSPKYDMRVSIAEKCLHMKYYAQIQQWTGEDWTSTGVTIAGTQLHYGTEEKTRHSSGEKPLCSRTTAPFDIPVTTPRNIAHAICTTILLGTFKMDATFRHRIGPEDLNRAYLEGIVTNQCPYAILPGFSSLFVDGNYVGDIRLNAAVPQAEFDVQLATDTEVDVAINPPLRLTKPSGGAAADGSLHVEEERTQELVITNRRKHPISCVLTQAIVKSPEESIKITLAYPKVTKEQLDNGQMKQLVDVPAMTSRSVRSVYKLTYPQAERRKAMF